MKELVIYKTIHIFSAIRVEAHHLSHLLLLLSLSLSMDLFPSTFLPSLHFLDLSSLLWSSSFPGSQTICTSSHYIGIQDLVLQFSGNLSIHHYSHYFSPCIRSCFYSAPHLDRHPSIPLRHRTFFTCIQYFTSSIRHYVLTLLSVFQPANFCLLEVNLVHVFF